MNSYIVDCLEPQPGSFTSTLRADARPHEHASSGLGRSPVIHSEVPIRASCPRVATEPDDLRGRPRLPTRPLLCTVTVAPESRFGWFDASGRAGGGAGRQEADRPAAAVGADAG